MPSAWAGPACGLGSAGGACGAAARATDPAVSVPERALAEFGLGAPRIERIPVGLIHDSFDNDRTGFDGDYYTIKPSADPQAQ